MSKLTKNERIAELEKQVAIISRILCTPSDVEPELKVLDQSVFNGLDDDIIYAVVKGNGEAAGFNIRPRPRGDSGFWAIDLSAKVVSLGQGYDASNWQNSLIERNKVELTSNDYYHSGIASKLLGRGQKLVVCFVSNVSEADALNEKTIEVITSVDTEFNDADDYGWQYVVPINNQGEPLTAADVGL